MKAVSATINIDNIIAGMITFTCLRFKLENLTFPVSVEVNLYLVKDCEGWKTDWQAISVNVQSLDLIYFHQK